MRTTRRQLKRILKEAAGEELVGEIQPLVDANQFLKGSVVGSDDLIEAGDYVIYASGEGLKHTKDRHLDANAPGSLIYPSVDLKDLISAIATIPGSSSGGMVKWEGVSSPIGAIGEMGLAVATPEEIAGMKDYTMPGGRGEKVKVAAGERTPTDEVTLVTALLGDLSDGRKALSLVTLYPGGMDVDGVTVPRDRGAFAAAGIYFVLPAESAILRENKMKISRKQLRQIIKEHLMLERTVEARPETDVFKIVVRSLSNDGPATHQELLADVLHEFPNISDEEIDSYIDSFEESGDIRFDSATQKYH